MTRSSLARRYAPLAALAAVQLLIIAVVPSTAPARLAAGGLSGTGSGSLSAGGPVDSGTGAGTAGGAGGVTGAAGGGPAGAAGARAGSATGAPAVPTGPAGSAASGDKSHCVGDREFDPAITYWAPPCVAGTPGAPLPTNGGATYAGVSADTITVIDYISNYGPEVNAILSAAKLIETYDEAVAIDKPLADFINAHYVLWGRKLKIIPIQGKSTSVPPDKQGLFGEIDQLIDTYHPFAFQWNTTLCSECFAEIARKGVIAFGGEGFSDDLSNALSPYFYDSGESSTRIEGAFADFYCKQLAGRTAAYALHNNPAQDFNGKPRVLGIISTNDPDNESTVEKFLMPKLAACGAPVTHKYFYDQNINTAAQQVAATIAAMDTTSNPATTVLCLCDSVAPAFLYQGEKQANYYPENLIASDQNMDTDSTGQSYTAPGSLGCPGGGACEFDVAMGLSIWRPQGPDQQMDGVKIYHAGGGQGSPATSGVEATIVYSRFIMLADLIENTGPGLTPASMRARAPALGTLGGGTTGLPKLSFGPGDWNWTQDARIVYWDHTATSPWNGAAGTFVAVEGSRFDLGQYPAQTCCPGVPART